MNRLIQGLSIISLLFSGESSVSRVGSVAISEAAMEEVCGEFDWIVSYEYLEQYLKCELVGIEDYGVVSALVIGCGTSNLSHSIATDLGVRQVVSLDNDEKCIQYMKEKYKQYDNMEWIVYDLVEPSKNNLMSDRMGDGTYDIIIDKGTLDAILVEGSISIMLCEIYRLLKPGGVYFLCSLHCPELLGALFRSPPLSMTVNFVGEGGTIDGKCRTVSICTKIRDIPPNLSDMERTESRVMDEFYQQSLPLLTDELKSQLQKIFQKCHSSCLSLSEIHQYVFDESNILSSLGYSFDLFLEDLERYPLSQEGFLSYDEFVEFLSKNQ